MIVTIPGLLSPAQVAQIRTALDSAPWIDGRATAGYLSQRAKANHQLPEDAPVARQLGSVILDELDKNQTFIAAALPAKVVPPLFNRYQGGEAYDDHIDGAIRPVAGTPHRVRTDLSATLFLSAPDSYDGGELVIGTPGEERSLKLPAGDMVLYPGGTVHRVTPVTRGQRIAAFFWVQSMVRGADQRAILFDLDNALQRLGQTGADHAACVRLAGVYHNLLRAWAEV